MPGRAVWRLCRAVDPGRAPPSIRTSLSARKPQAFAQPIPQPFAARARRHRGAGELSLLRVGETVEAGGGHHRDIGGDPTSVEGDPDGPGEVLVPGLRDDHAAAGPVPPHAPRPLRTKPSR